MAASAASAFLTWVWCVHGNMPVIFTAIGVERITLSFPGSSVLAYSPDPDGIVGLEHGETGGGLGGQLGLIGSPIIMEDWSASGALRKQGLDSSEPGKPWGGFSNIIS